MNIIKTIFLKELNNVHEIISKKDNKLKAILKLVYKKIIGNIIIKENGIAILPYSNIKRFKKIKIYFIKKVLEKLEAQVVLSKYLSTTELKPKLSNSNIKLIEEKKLADYLYIPIVEYICKIKHEQIYKQEITILVKKYTTTIAQQIIELLKNTKRVQIVTPNLKQFERIESMAEEITGMPCQITNNRRKSLSKANIIINIDFDEKMLNAYNINRQAIIININNKTKITSKLFEGINVLDYQIAYENSFNNVEYKNFDNKLLYESIITDQNYEQTRQQVINDKVKIVNLIGKNGVINIKEFMKL